MGTNLPFLYSPLFQFRYDYRYDNFTIKMHTILGEEFTIDELRDIANYGADTGVHGFIYSTELADKFDANEYAIEDYLDTLGFTMHDVMLDRHFGLFNSTKNGHVGHTLSAMLAIFSEMTNSL